MSRLLNLSKQKPAQGKASARLASASRKGSASRTQHKLDAGRTHSTHTGGVDGLKSTQSGGALLGGGGLWATYLRMLETKPLLTKAITSGLIAGMGDYMCQRMEARERAKEKGTDVESGEVDWGVVDRRQRQHSTDWGRWAKFTFLGTFLVAPCLHGWYGLLARRIPDASLFGVVRRVCLDQLLFAPVFTATFFGCLTLLEGRLAYLPDKLKADYWDTLKANWVLWIPAQLLNFGLVPAPFQVLFANVVGLFWNTILSKQAFKQPVAEHAL